MDIGRSFTFVFDDEAWLKKLVVGGLIAFIPIVNFAAMGYVVQLVRNVRDNAPHPLPDWDNFGQYFSDGLKLLVAFIVYSLPMLLVLCAFGGLSVAMGSASNNSNSLGGAFAVVAIGLECIMFILMLIPVVFMPAIFARLADEGTIGATLRFGEVFGFITSNLGNYIIVLLLSFAVMYMVAPLGVIACLVGVLFTQWWAYLVFGHLTGQLARNNALMV